MHLFTGKTKRAATCGYSMQSSFDDWESRLLGCYVCFVFQSFFRSVRLYCLWTICRFAMTFLLLLYFNFLINRDIRSNAVERWFTIIRRHLRVHKLIMTQSSCYEHKSNLSARKMKKIIIIETDSACKNIYYQQSCSMLNLNVVTNWRTFIEFFVFFQKLL